MSDLYCVNIGVQYAPSYTKVFNIYAKLKKYIELFKSILRTC